MSNCSGGNPTGRFSQLVNKHPCFDRDAHGKFGRIHLPVSPVCNIQCRFCKRSLNKTEQRPGVTRAILTPVQAVLKVQQALELCPEITVSGIAGPGDTLATDHALRTFELINEKFPQLINCLSTNGLRLREKSLRVVNAGVKTVTVTVNSVEPRAFDQIYEYIRYKGQPLSGEYAAHVMREAQLEGIAKVSGLGAVVKINTVLVPGVNDDQVEEIARLTSEAGASIINIIPLIPQNQMAHLPVPGCEEVNKAREDAERYLSVFRHCKHCRADACGIPGIGLELADKLYDRAYETTFSHG